MGCCFGKMPVFLNNYPQIEGNSKLYTMNKCMRIRCFISVLSFVMIIYNFDYKWIPNLYSHNF